LGAVDVHILTDPFSDWGRTLHAAIAPERKHTDEQEEKKDKVAKKAFHSTATGNCYRIILVDLLLIALVALVAFEDCFLQMQTAWFQLLDILIGFSGNDL
jgi:hypothetical protein